MKKLKTALQSRYFIKIIAISIFLLSILKINFCPLKSKYQKNETTFIGKVISYKIDGDKLSITIKAKEKIIANYYFKTKKEKDYYKSTLHLGNKIKLTGTLTLPTRNTIPNGFNYKEYLYYHKIHYSINTNKIEKIENNTSILYFIKNKIIKRLNKIDDTGYIRTFILGDKNFLDEETIEKYQENGISHLFAISGMHISFITGILLFLLGKITYNNYYKYSIVILFLFFYLFLTNYSASIIRTTTIFILNALNKCFNLKIKKIDIMLLTLSIICIINPYILYDIGFQFSYIISFTLIVLGKKVKGKIKQSLYTSYLCFISSIPICLYHFYQINILSIILNLVMIPLVSIIVFPFSLIVFILPKLTPIYHIIISLLETTNHIASKINILCLTFSKPSIILVVILYIIIFLTINNKKYLIILIGILLIWKYFPYINPNYNITFINVGQGDSTLIIFPNIKSTILIDTGGKVKTQKEEWQKRKHNFLYTTDTTIPHLKSLGIMKINYLILTHGDYDHMGEAINLVNNFKVEKVIFNCGAYNDLESELIKVLDKKKIKYYSCIKELNIDNNKLYFLQTSVYDNENDNSNVIYTELSGYKFMLMGDASSTTEKEIMNKYNLPDIDVLKVGHHGSKTSSNKEFIDEINPKYSIISVGKNNRYGHPNKEVLDNLKDSKIYRTDEDGSIMFKIKNNKLKIETCSP